MLAALLYGKNDLRTEEIQRPAIAADEILMRTRSAPVCGTDVRMFRNGHASVSRESPLILGHEMSGVVEVIGSGVTGFSEGERIVVAPNMGCNNCYLCASGDSHLCTDYRAFGIHFDGAFAEYVRIRTAAIQQGNVMSIADHVTFDQAALAEPLSCVFNGFERCQIKGGDTVLIIGAGPIGMMHAKFANMAGAQTVIVNDINQQRLDQCRQLDPSLVCICSDMKEVVMESTNGRGADVCITACPAPAAQVAAMDVAAVNGRICFFGGLRKDKSNVTLDTNLIHYRQLIVTGTTRASLRQFRDVLSLITEGRIQVDDLVTAKFELEQIHEAIDHTASGKTMKSVIEFN